MGRAAACAVRTGYDNARMKAVNRIDSSIMCLVFLKCQRWIEIGKFRDASLAETAHACAAFRESLLRGKELLVFGPRIHARFRVRFRKVPLHQVLSYKSS